MQTVLYFFFKQETAYEMRISDWSSDVCSSDLRSERCPAHVVIDLQRAGDEPLVELPDDIGDERKIGAVGIELVHRDATDRQADKLRLQRGRSALGVMAAELEVDGQAVGGLPVEPRLTQHGAQAVRLLDRKSKR